MRIGKFKDKDYISIGAVHDNYWADLPMLLKLNDEDVGDAGIDFFLAKNSKELGVIDSKVKESFNNKEFRSKVFHKLKEDSFLSPVPKTPRLLTMRGAGALFSRAISLKMPCQPVFELRYPYNLKGHNCVAVLPEIYKSGGWNIEFIAVMGKEGKDIKEADVYDHVAGYTIMIDHPCAFSTSPFENEWFVKPEEREMVDHFYAGCFNGNVGAPTPIGPWITTADEIPDPHDLWTTEREHNRFVSKGHTSGVLFTFPQVISYISRFITLKPGDMISSSSISYDGYRHWECYEKGAFIEVSAEKIGNLRMYIEDKRGNS